MCIVIARILTGKPKYLLIRIYAIQHIKKLRHIMRCILLDFSLTVKAATLIFISGCVSASPSAKEGKSGFIYNLVKS